MDPCLISENQILCNFKTLSCSSLFATAERNVCPLQLRGSSFNAGLRCKSRGNIHRRKCLTYYIVMTRNKKTTTNNQVSAWKISRKNDNCWVYHLALLYGKVASELTMTEPMILHFSPILLVMRCPIRQIWAAIDLPPCTISLWSTCCLAATWLVNMC